jgi:hypothetical protein
MDIDSMLRGEHPGNGVFGNYDPPQIKLAQNGAGCNGMLSLSATLCCHWRLPEELLILPPGAIQSCHLIRSGLDCQIPLSQAAWRLQSEQSGSKVRFARDSGVTRIALDAPQKHWPESWEAGVSREPAESEDVP